MANERDKRGHEIADEAAPCAAAGAEDLIGVESEHGPIQQRPSGRGPPAPAVAETSNHLPDHDQVGEFGRGRLGGRDLHAVIREVPDGIAGGLQVVVLGVIGRRPGKPVTARPVSGPIHQVLKEHRP